MRLENAYDIKSPKDVGLFPFTILQSKACVFLTFNRHAARNAMRAGFDGAVLPYVDVMAVYV